VLNQKNGQPGVNLVVKQSWLDIFKNYKSICLEIELKCDSAVACKCKTEYFRFVCERMLHFAVKSLGLLWPQVFGVVQDTRATTNAKCANNTCQGVLE
jgi:hypothetical protein